MTSRMVSHVMSHMMVHMMSHMMCGKAIYPANVTNSCKIPSTLKDTCYGLGKISQNQQLLDILACNPANGSLAEL